MIYLLNLTKRSRPKPKCYGECSRQRVSGITYPDTKLDRPPSPSGYTEDSRA